MELWIVKKNGTSYSIAGCVQMVTCLFPHKGEENTEILNIYLNVLDRDIFKVSTIARSKKPEQWQLINLKNEYKVTSACTKYFVLSYVTAIAEQEWNLQCDMTTNGLWTAGSNLQLGADALWLTEVHQSQLSGIGIACWR